MNTTKIEFEEILNDLFNEGIFITNFNMTRNVNSSLCYETGITLEIKTTNVNFIQALMDFGGKMYRSVPVSVPVSAPGSVPILSVSSCLKEQEERQEVDNFSEVD